jgi:Flp pilus assembly protein TadB
MTCSECNAAAVAVGQRYCHVCGAQLPHGINMTNATAGAAPLYMVGDGSDHAMSALTRQLTVDWLRTHKGRIALYAGVATVAVVVVAAVIVAAVVAIAAIMPVLVALFVLYLIARPRRRRRRLMRTYRF